MEEEILKNLSNLRSLTDFVYQPVYPKEYLLGIQMEELAYFIPNETTTEELLDPTIFGFSFTWPWPFDKIGWFFTRAFQALEELWDKIKSWWNSLPIWWLKDTLEKLRDFWYTLRDRLAQFVWNPLGFLGDVISNIVERVRSFSQNVVINIGSFVDSIWSNLYNYIKPRFDNLWIMVSSKIAELGSGIVQAIQNTVHLISDPIGQTFSWLWDRMEAFFEPILKALEGAIGWVGRAFEHIWWNLIVTIFPFKEGLLGDLKIKMDEAVDKEERLFYYRLWSKINAYKASRPTVRYLPGSMIEMTRLALTDPAQFLIKLNEELSDEANAGLAKVTGEALEKVGGWMENWFNFLTEKAYAGLDKLELAAPSENLTPFEYFRDLMASAAKVLGGMTGLAVAVAALSKLQLGPIAAILYDMSGYKYITGAIIGGLTTAAFVQPLKYFDWRIFLDLRNRNVISKEELRYWGKWYGFKDKLIWYFERYVATPISLLRQSDFVPWGNATKGELFEEMMFSGLEVAGCKLYLPALWMRGMSMWLTRMVTEMMYAVRRGFATVSEMEADIKALLSGTEKITSSGHRELPTLRKMPERAEILEMIRKWSTIRLKGDGMVTEITSEFAEDLIDEDEARRRLSEVIKIPELVEGELAPIRARKKTRTEPEKEKLLN